MFQSFIRLLLEVDPKCLMNKIYARIRYSHLNSCIAVCVFSIEIFTLKPYKSIRFPSLCPTPSLAFTLLRSSVSISGSFFFRILWSMTSVMKGHQRLSPPSPLPYLTRTITAFLEMITVVHNFSSVSVTANSISMITYVLFETSRQ